MNVFYSELFKCDKNTDWQLSNFLQYIFYVCLTDYGDIIVFYEKNQKQKLKYLNNYIIFVSCFDYVVMNSLLDLLNVYICEIVLNPVS